MKFNLNMIRTVAVFNLVALVATTAFAAGPQAKGYARLNPLVEKQIKASYPVPSLMATTTYATALAFPGAVIGSTWGAWKGTFLPYIDYFSGYSDAGFYATIGKSTLGGMVGTLTGGANGMYTAAKIPFDHRARAMELRESALSLEEARQASLVSQAPASKLSKKKVTFASSVQFNEKVKPVMTQCHYAARKISRVAHSTAKACLNIAKKLGVYLKRS